MINKLQVKVKERWMGFWISRIVDSVKYRGILLLTKEIIYEIYFYMKNLGFKYLFIVNTKDLDVSTELQREAQEYQPASVLHGIYSIIEN